MGKNSNECKIIVFFVFVITAFFYSVFVLSVIVAAILFQTIFKIIP